MASLAGVALASLGFVLGDSLAVYFPARFAMGFASGGLWIGVTFGTLERWPGQEYVCMSRIFAAYSIGGLIGPALGAIGGIATPFAVYMLLVLAAIPLVLVMPGPDERRAFASDRSALRTRAFWLAASGILFATLALAMLEGVLPLHFADRLSQAEIGGLFVAVSLVVAASAAAAGSQRPRPLVFASVLLASAGIAIAGATGELPPWLLGLALAAVGIGIGNTGSLGILVESVSVERIVTAMVVWSQVAMLGYLIGPLAGGLVAEGLGFEAIGIVPAAAGLLVLALFYGVRRAGRAPRATGSRSARPL
jgi:MFS family permease